jgi:hypothetical protein
LNCHWTATPDANRAANTDAVTTRARRGVPLRDRACATSSTANAISGSAARATGDSGSHGSGRQRIRRRVIISMATTDDVAEAAASAIANSQRRPVPGAPGTSAATGGAAAASGIIRPGGRAGGSRKPPR